MAEQVGRLYYEVVMETKALIAESRKVEERLQRIADRGTGVQLSLTKMAAAVSAAIGAIAIDGFVSKLVNTQRQFDVMFASLKTMTGGADQAGAAFERLRKFAAQTPYTLEQSVQGFTKLKALGLDPSERAMTSFGNTASAMGKDLMQMIEAVADASTGEFERLKEFGIKARVEGDKVALTFQGTTTKVQNSAAAITDYLVKIGETNFAGAMSERMKTLDGDISNLQDSLSALYLQISQAGVGDAIARGVRMATEAIQEMSASVKQGGLTEYFDGMRPYIHAAEVAVVTLAGAISGKLVLAFVDAAAKAYGTAAGMGAATVAARGFSAVLAALGGPVGIIITGLALLALNWDRVAGSARTAAEVSEKSAQRIADALRKGPRQAGSELAEQLKDIEKQLSKTERQIKDGSIRSIYGKRETVTPKDELDALSDRRDALIKAREDIQKAMNTLHGGAGRGKVNPALVEPNESLAATPDAPSKKGAKFDSASYLASLEAATLEGVERVNAIEREGLRKNAALLAAGDLTREKAAKADLLVQARAAADRLDLLVKEGADRAVILESDREKEREAARRLADEQKRGQASAMDNIVAEDPIARLELQLQRELDLNLQKYMADQANAELYAQERLALEQNTAAKIKEIRDKQNAEEQGRQSQQLTNYSNLFGGLADITKTFAGKQSGAYKAMFAVSKAFSIAQATMSIATGAAKAWELGWPLGIPAAATVLAQGASLMSTIKGANYGGGRQYGGPVAAGSLYRVGEGNRPEMFQGDSGRSYMIPGEKGKVVSNADMMGGASGREPTVIIEHHGTPFQVQSQSYDREQNLLRLVTADHVNQIRNNSGPLYAAFRESTNVRGAGL
ncbi:tape measure protein [Paucibacter sp. M5-1]|uniref:tape measure protein n=1 Tax=Paucibacter sp. M5-1 TaxID=3015998 RepID=UPI0022B928AC|nr:tape measure protein [Paucibacter sp. M5-1]MCZ7883798.1 tape measure protein [Paucibacter sp. M5-1]